MDTATLQARTEYLTDAETVNGDMVLELIEIRDALKQQTKDAVDLANAFILDWLQKHGELTNGSMRYYVGKAKSEKCVDIKATVEAVFNAAGGDLAELVRCLSSNAFKPGTTRKLLGDDTPLFQTVWKDKIELKEVDTQFVQ